MGVDFSAGKDDFAPIQDFDRRLAEETGVESDLAGLIRDYVDKDAIRLRAGEDGARNRDFPDLMGGTDPITFTRSVFEIRGRNLSGKPADAEPDRCIDPLHPHRQLGRILSVRHIAGQTGGSDRLGGRAAGC